MKNIITIVTIMIILIGITSAIYAGECDTIEFPNDEPVECDITGNSFDMEGFSWTKEGTTIEYCFDVAYKPDNFTITWWNDEDEVSTSSNDRSSSNTNNHHYNAGTLVWPYSKWLEEGDTIIFKLSQYHTLTITFINKDFVLIEIESDIIYIDLKEGEEKNISVEGRGYHDLSIKLNQIKNDEAYITLRRIFELVHVEEYIEKDTEVKEDFTEIKLDDTTKEDVTDKSYDYKRYISIIILVVLLIGFYFLVNKYLKKEETETEEEEISSI